MDEFQNQINKIKAEQKVQQLIIRVTFKLLIFILRQEKIIIRISF